MRMRIFKTFFVGVFFKGFCRGSEYSKKELGNRLVFLFHGFYGFYSKKYVFRMAKRFLFGKRSIKSPTKQGTRGKNIFFSVLQENREKRVQKCPKTVAQMLEITQPSLNICEIFINNSPLLPSKELTGSHLKGGSRRRLTNGNKKTFFRSPKNGFDLSPSSE